MIEYDREKSYSIFFCAGSEGTDGRLLSQPILKRKEKSYENRGKTYCTQQDIGMSGKDRS